MADVPTTSPTCAKPYLDKNARHRPKMLRAMRWLAYMRAADLPPWGGCPPLWQKAEKSGQGVVLLPACAGASDCGWLRGRQGQG